MATPHIANPAPISIQNARLRPRPCRDATKAADVPIAQSYEYWNALRRHGVKTEFVVYPDEGHIFFKRADQADVATRLVAWFNTYLGSEQPSGAGSAR